MSYTFHILFIQNIVKPIDEELLIVRIKAILRRTGLMDRKTEQYQIGAYLFDVREQVLHWNNEKQKLTNKESELLAILALHKNRLVERKNILRDLWGNVDEFSRKSMDVFISRLRKYLNRAPRISIQNIHSKGFILSDESSNI